MSVLAVLYFLLFAALGAEVPFLPRVLVTLGPSAGQVGAILSAGTIVQVVVSPIFGRLADRVGTRSVLFVAALTSSASLLLLSVASGGFRFALPIYVLFAMATAPLNPLADAIAVPACARAGIPYGRVRGIGSAGFFVGVLSGSAIAERAGVAAIIFVAAIFFTLMTATLPLLGHAARQVSPGEPADGIGTLLRIPALRRVFAVAALVIGSHAMADAFAVIHWHASGVGEETIGVMLSAAVVSELLVFMFVGPMLLRRFGPSACAVIGALFGVMRWAVLAESQRVWPVLTTQLFHGLSFSLVHLACMQVLGTVAPARLFATAQSLYGICANAIASAAVTFAAGILFGVVHAHAFWLAAALCISAVPIALKLGTEAVFATTPRRRDDGLSHP